ncbi:hypothetical protein CAAN4_B09340 [[Candida] anglica]|uniref:PA14 domain-containing protein n=1 Tax=[Candida] anglica TaxID=148631 RepID=A0ABP0EAG5_9ASCO
MKILRLFSSIVVFSGIASSLETTPTDDPGGASTSLGCSTPYETGIACSVPGTGKAGLHAQFYQYDWYDFDTLDNIEFLTTGYRERKKLASTDGVVDIELWVNNRESKTATEIIYGQTMNQNFVVELTGYFLASETNDFYFTLQGESGGVILQLGDGNAFPCCKTTHTGSEDDAMYGGVDRRIYALQEGLYYPIKIVYGNPAGPIELDVYVSTPDTRDYPIKDRLFSFPDREDGCPNQFQITTITMPWTGTVTSTSTVTPHSTDGTTTIEILTPSSFPSPTGCEPPADSVTPGLFAIFHTYGYDDNDHILDIDFMTSGYRNTKTVGTVSKVIDFEIDIDPRGSWTRVYGLRVSENFLVELTGYILLPESTDYIFTLTADDSATLQIGAGIAFPCCNTNGAYTDKDAMFAPIDVISSDTGHATKSYFLTKGIYYPIKMVYVNVGGLGIFKVSVRTPYNNDFPLTKYLYSVNTKVTTCPLPSSTTISTTSTGDFTSASTTASSSSHGSITSSSFGSTNASSSDYSTTSGSDSATPSDASTASDSTSPTASNSDSSTASGSGSMNPSGSGSTSASDSGSATASGSGSMNPTGSGSATASGSGSATASGSGSATASGSGSMNPTDSGSATASGSGSATASDSGSATASGSGSMNPTDSGSATASGSGSMNPSDSGSATASGSGSMNPTDSGSATASGSGSMNPTDSGSATASDSGSMNPTGSGSTTASSSGSMSPTGSGSATASGSGSATASDCGSMNPSDSGTATASGSGSINPSGSGSFSSTDSGVVTRSTSPSSSESGSNSGSISESSYSSGAPATYSPTYSSSGTGTSSGSVTRSDPGLPSANTSKSEFSSASELSVSSSPSETSSFSSCNGSKILTNSDESSIASSILSSSSSQFSRSLSSQDDSSSEPPSRSFTLSYSSKYETTTTVHTITTSYTTHCPSDQSASNKSESYHTTTTKIVTFCDDHTCTEVTQTIGANMISTTKKHASSDTSEATSTPLDATYSLSTAPSTHPTVSRIDNSAISVYSISMVTFLLPFIAIIF